MTTSHVQPDLFGALDDAVERMARLREPATCPCCGTTERNGFLLKLNHGIEEDGTVCGFPIGEHPSYGDRCVAQSLVTNHIRYAARNAAEGRQGWLEQLDRDVARGRELNLDVDQIVDEVTKGKP